VTDFHAEGKTQLREVHMKKTIAIVSLFFLLFLGTSSLSQGAGFLVYEHGAAAMGIAGAFIGVANDVTAIFHNPAGIAWLEGTHISVGTTLITAVASVNLPNWPDPRFQTVDLKKQWFYPSTFYISHKINDRLAAGFGFFSPFGLGTKWPEDYPLRYISIADDMKTFIFNPCIAYKVTDNFSVGFGISYIHATISFELVERKDDIETVVPLGPPVIPFPFQVPVTATVDIPADLDGTGNAFGWNAGLLYKGENYSLGVNWRSGFTVKFDGDLALFTDEAVATATATVPPGLEAVKPIVEQGVEQNILYALSFVKGGTAALDFKFPHILGFGGGFWVTDNLMLSADVHIYFFGSFDALNVEIDVPSPDPSVEFEDKHIEENWDNTYIIRTGIQYMLNENVALRGGFFYDKNPQPTESVDPILPDADRLGFTAGFGYKGKNFTLDLAYQYEPFKDRESPNRDIYTIGAINLGEGTYKNTAHLFGLSLGYHF